MQARFINPFTDYGFKKLFGEEASKPFLIDFLNAMLPAHHQIKDLTLKNSEQMGISDFDRKAIYDIYCQSHTGERFIVELQRAKQTFFKDRTLYYATFPINEQAQKGEWNYQLKAVYCISILDFLFDEHKDDPEVIYTVQLKDQNNQIFYDKLTLIYLQLPNFCKKEHELVTPLDKWLFFIKNLEDLQYIPAIFKDSIIEQAFEKANLATFNRQEIDKYERSLKVYRDLHNSLETAIKDGFYQGMEHGLQTGLKEGLQKGMQQGIEQGKYEQKIATAKTLKGLHISPKDIALATGLDIDEINAL
ncbi:flagellar assembly protein H [Moraxella caprae]|uniref:Flagellar assembly protein H n=1 Tax=Moraxella caprae TaxID=90240 RepID=A0A378QX13_9GAMM|nr:Rpn family recombination-promoting nuclease/putative transposase [Moraxella caprae]STZ07524.1 flagellar assembly protein H [Moraxella caprae]